MALMYGRELRRVLEEEGVYNDVCELSRAVYEELRVVWQEVAQRIGMASGILSGMADEIREIIPVEGIIPTYMLIIDQARRKAYTGPLRELLEVVYTGGSGSAGGLGLLSYVCGFDADARFLITRKAIDVENLNRALELLLEAGMFIENYAYSSIEGVVGLVHELNEIVSDVASDILEGREVFNMAEIEAQANEAIEAMREFTADMVEIVDSFRGVIEELG